MGDAPPLHGWCVCWWPPANMTPCRRDGLAARAPLHAHRHHAAAGLSLFSRPGSGLHARKPARTQASLGIGLAAAATHACVRAWCAWCGCGSGHASRHCRALLCSAAAVTARRKRCCPCSPSAAHALHFQQTHRLHHGHPNTALLTPPLHPPLNALLTASHACTQPPNNALRTPPPLPPTTTTTLCPRRQLGDDALPAVQRALVDGRVQV